MLFLAPTFTSAIFVSPGRDCLEGKHAHFALSIDSADAGRTRGGIDTSPLPSSRCTSATGWPSPPSSPPGVHVHQLQDLGIELDLQRHGEDIVRVREDHRGGKVLPTVCVELAGAIVSVTGWSDGSGCGGLRRLAGIAYLRRCGGMACCFICCTMAVGRVGCVVVLEAGAVPAWPALSGNSLSSGVVRPAQFDRRFSCAGVDGRACSAGSAPTRARCAGSG